MSVPGDGIDFDAENIVLQETQVDAGRRGIRAMFAAYPGNAAIPMQIDFGFSDKLASEPETISYPTLLPDWDDPQLKSYPIAAIVAEKFHAMERFSATPSRWKDYYDIWLTLSSFHLSAAAVRDAIAKTFATRATPIPSARPASLTIEFALEHQAAWTAFLKKYELENPEIDDLSKVVNLIWSFLERPLAASRTVMPHSTNTGG